ncbi:MAG: tRNA dihydrouridine(20/20a) synthase DusA [Rhizobiaceae bacterium]|nr:tRNA dihydrouridine(20/20a) synthase DusA [Rhizobiaceae bacterium]
MYITGRECGQIFAVAPMMDWSDRHCRFFHRVMTKKSLLYTEMVVADAVIHGDRNYLLGFDGTEHPVALQLGGSDPRKLADAAQIGEQFGYDEINLNVGCPSDRVQSGTFGACLMREPELVAKCVAAMKAVVDVPVTVKCRIGVDDQDPGPALDDLAKMTWEEGSDAIWVHARKAWLQGLSPKENRDIPPLDYDRVFRLKDENRSRFIGINGGVENLIQVAEHLENVDGCMLGRAAYHNPSLLREVDQRVYGSSNEPITYDAVIDAMCGYAEQHISQGGRLNQITRHMIGLFQGIPGARGWRQVLSTEAVKPGAGSEVILKAYERVREPAEAA